MVPSRGEEFIFRLVEVSSSRNAKNIADLNVGDLEKVYMAVLPRLIILY